MTEKCVGHLRLLIRDAGNIYIRPFLGNLNQWIKISKKDAFLLFANYEPEYPISKLEIEDCHICEVKIDKTDKADLYLG